MNSLDVKNTLQELITSPNTHLNLSVAQLIEKALRRNEGVLAENGALRVTTGKYTGRSPKDKFVVDEDSIRDLIDWGTVNQKVSTEIFNNLYVKVLDYLKEKEELFIFKGFAGADERYRMHIQVINEFAWHNLFAHQMFIRPTEEEVATINPEFTVVYAPTFKADPVIDGTRSETFIYVSYEKRVVLIGGTEYAGEMKKSIFSVMNTLLPNKNVLPMHCSSNVGNDGDVALFFGLSGTGKTTLSADPNRQLIGDDEHGWSDKGVFNFEGGCYAKTVGLTREKEPQIFDAVRYGALLENVPLNDVREPDYFDTSLTENTRVAYPITSIDNVLLPSVAGHPHTIIFLTADATGVLPPISKLTKEQAMFHFLSGYTSKLAGTERGITSPQATFSTCFGSPFLPLPAHVYAEMLGEKITEHNAEVYLVNTGWTGGEYGVGKRMNLGYTRAMVTAAVEGKLRNVETEKEDVFGLAIPVEVPGVPSEVLQPKKAWADIKAYEQKAYELANSFKENFKKYTTVSPEIAEKGGPIA